MIIKALQDRTERKTPALFCSRKGGRNETINLSYDYNMVIRRGT